jgi:hypothetical protein
VRVSPFSAAMLPLRSAHTGQTQTHTGQTQTHTQTQTQGVSSLQRLALRVIRSNMPRLDAMCRAYARSSAAAAAIGADTDTDTGTGAGAGAAGAGVGGVEVSVELAEEVLVAAPRDQLAACVRALERVCPVLRADPACDDRYWRAAVTR